MVGKNLSHYKILEELGRGGMGIVYKAEDTKLDRTVAIKVLPSAALASDDDRARFYREAKAAAQLHHPHIASVFEIDEAVPEGSKDDDLRPFIAMEFIEGKTLDAKVKEGPFKLEEAVRIASEIASALEAAHKKDIVHRDIKSQNVMLTEEGAAKVLDFGLALTAQSTKLTRLGSTLGTVSYMSPEQTRGEEVDLRSDLWSLGVVVYEMITGKHPFAGDYEQAIVYSILNEEAEPPTGIRTGVPMQLEWLVTKLLAKKADDRYQSAMEVRVDLKQIDLSGSGARSHGAETERSEAISQSPFTYKRQSTGPGIRLSIPLLLVTIALFVGLGYSIRWFIVPPAPKPLLTKLPLYLPEITEIRFPEISPTSEFMAFRGYDRNSREGIFLLDLKSSETHLIPGTKDAGNIKFSPDGNNLAYSLAFDSGIYVVAIPRGVPQQISQIGFNLIWENDGSIIYTDRGRDGGLYRIDIDKKVATPIVIPDSIASDVQSYRASSVLTHNRWLVGHATHRSNATSLFRLDLKSSDLVHGEQGIISPSFVPGGFLSYQLGSTKGEVLVRAFDFDSGKFVGPPQNVLPEIRASGYSVGVDGSLLHAPKSFAGTANNHVFMIDTQALSIDQIEITGYTEHQFEQISFSPEGNQFAVKVNPLDGPDGFVGTYDVRTEVLTQRTFNTNREYPSWSSDGLWLYFNSLSPETVFQVSLSGDGAESAIIENGFGADDSDDGNWVAFARTIDASNTDIIARNMTTGMEVTIDSSSGHQHNADISPDGRFVLYETLLPVGPRVVVRPVRGNGYLQVSEADAFHPKWSPNGDYVYFVANDAIHRVPVSVDPSLQVIGQAEVVVLTKGFLWFDLDSTGTRLGVTAEAIYFPGGEIEQDVATLVWWQNWAQSLSNE